MILNSGYAFYYDSSVELHPELSLNVKPVAKDDDPALVKRALCYIKLTISWELWRI